MSSRVREGAGCLIVEDDARLRKAMGSALGKMGWTVREAGSVGDAIAEIAVAVPGLLLLDVALPDGRARDVLRALEGRSPAPRIVAMSGSAEPDESFELAALGVRVYLKKPIDLAELERAVGRALSIAPDLVPPLRAAVGLVSMKNVEHTVRDTMVREVLARGQGSRRKSSARTRHLAAAPPAHPAQGLSGRRGTP
jgi:DNA-binding response OmpR family regulator